MLQKSFRVIRFKLAQHVPDSGQEHLANSDDCLFMILAGFNPVIPLFKFRVLFGFDHGIGDLDKKRFQITAGAGDPSGFHFLVALVITRTATTQETRCLYDGNTDISGPISERMAIAVTGFLSKPG